MWLLSTDRAELHFFPSPEAVTGGYAILSHTWGDDEQSFVDTRDLTDWCKKSRKIPRDFSSDKVRQCCILAERHGYHWIWDDTCCIDKTSSSELSEAINSMFLWYSCAEVCYVYMGDVEGDCDLRAPNSSFRTARWHFRGWTLQELIAPSLVVFVSRDWKTIFGNKVELAPLLQDITGIPSRVLTCEVHYSLYSIAERMAWASKRNTTRVEDEAYSLMGLFNINMPTIYGEGVQAFVRLQQEIMKGTFDTSLFAWGSCLACHDKDVPVTPNEMQDMYQHFNASSRKHVYLLAQSPKSFVRPFDQSLWFTPSLKKPMQPYSQWQRKLSLDTSQANESGPFDREELPRFSVSNYGLEGRLPIIESDGFVVAVLLCDNGREHFGLLLHPSNTLVQDPLRRRYNVGYGFRRATHRGQAEQPRLIRLISLGSDIHNTQVNGKVAKATWQDILITETPPQMQRDAAPSLCAPLHSIAPVPPFRLPPWLVGRLAQLGMELLPLHVKSLPVSGKPLLVMATFDSVADAGQIEGIRLVLGTCTRSPHGPPPHWAAAKPRTPGVHGYNLNPLWSHDCRGDHIEDWEGWTRDFGDAERTIRLSFSRSTVLPERTLVVHIELEGSVYSAMKERKRVVLPPREDDGLARSHSAAPPVRSDLNETAQ